MKKWHEGAFGSIGERARKEDWWKDGARNWFDYAASCFFGRFSRGQDAAASGFSPRWGTRIVVASFPRSRPSITADEDVAEDAWFHLSVANQNRSTPWTAEMGMNYYRSNRWKSHQPCYNRPPTGSLEHRRIILWISFQSLYQSVKPERVTSYKSFAK